MVRPKVNESIDVLIRPLDHQVDIQWQLGGFTKGGDGVRAESDVLYEVTVHHIAVQPISPTLFRSLRVPREVAEIARQNRWGDNYFWRGSHLWDRWMSSIS